VNPQNNLIIISLMQQIHMFVNVLITLIAQSQKYESVVLLLFNPVLPNLFSKTTKKIFGKLNFMACVIFV